MRDHTPVSLGDFRGRFARGLNDVCPKEYAIDELNLEYTESGVKTRAGSKSFKQATGSWDGSVRRVFEFKKRNEASRLLILDSSGNIWDSTTTMTTAVLSIGTMTDFSAVTIFERCYISPHDGDVGLSNEKVYVYDGSGTARSAAGAAPSGYTLAAANSTESGNVEKGTHLFSVAFETLSGHITKFGLAGNEVKQYEAPGNKKVDLSGIPTGGSYVTKRHIIVTKVLADYDGNPNDKQWYFLPGGTIGDNTTTILDDVNFYDSDLINSAERLMNQLGEIPAASCIASYGGRMVTGGEAANNATLRVSDAGYPESMSDLEGFVNVDPGDAGGALHHIVEHRGLLYSMKDYRTYATKDNGAAPSTWEVLQVDAAQGCGVHGSSGVLDSKGQTLDMFLVCSRTGLQKFTGTYGDSRELSYPIESIWKRINPLYFDQVGISIDPIRKRAYIAVPLDSAVEPSHLLMMDFSEDLSFDRVKWSTWTFPKKTTSTWIEVDNTTREAILKFGASDGGIYELDESLLNDWGTAINSYYRAGYVALDDSGIVLHFHALRVRGVGSGNLDFTLYGEDDANTLLPSSVSLASAPGKEYYRVFSFSNEKASVKFGVSSANEWFHVHSVRMAVAPLWEERVQV